MEQNWTYEELEDIQSLMDRSGYNHSQRVRIYDLYNRIYNTNKSPTSCGKCLIGKLKGIRLKYEEERKKRNEG